MADTCSSHPSSNSPASTQKSLLTEDSFFYEFNDFNASVMRKLNCDPGLHRTFETLLTVITPAENPKRPGILLQKFRRDTPVGSSELPAYVREFLRKIDEGHCCVICLEKFTRARGLVRVACSHVFHRRCILPWIKLKSGKTCPTCRRPVGGGFMFL